MLQGKHLCRTFSPPRATDTSSQAFGLDYDVVAPLALRVEAMRKGLPSRSRFPRREPRPTA